MPAEFPILLEMAAVLLLAGVGAGLIAGLLGVGGGIILVPVLYYLFTAMGIDEAVRMHVAVGTSLTTIIATSIASIHAHHKRGAVDLALLRSWGPGILIGTLIGGLIASAVKGAALTGIFATLATLIGLYMALGQRTMVISNHLPGPLGAYSLGALIGGISTMMGIGGGSLSVPILSLFGYPIHRAIGTAAAIGFIIGVPGPLYFMFSGWNVSGLPPYSLGYVNLLGTALIVPASMLLAPLGARLSHRLNTRKLKTIFGIFLMIMAGQMLVKIFRG